MNIKLRYLIVILAVLVSMNSFGKELDWPREIKVKEYVITLYEPQMETFEQNTLTGRMALSLKGKDRELTFGALWFNAILLTDMESRTAILSKLEIPMIKFPDVENETHLEALKEVIIADLESVDMVMSLDRIIANLEDADTENMLSDDLKNDPPKIYYRSSPSVLIFIDGDPVLKKVEGNSAMEYVQNTPYLIVKFKGSYYIKGGEYWYTSAEILADNWKTTTTVPKEVAEQGKKNGGGRKGA